MEFDEAFLRVVEHEGGWSRDPTDAANWTGGALGSGELRGTRYGVSAAQYPDLDIEHLALGAARDIYRRDYWDRCRCDQLPAWIRLHVFDAAVNSGVFVASMWLQRAAGVTADGIIGARTIATVRSADPWRAIALLTAYRLEHITHARSWAHHGRGWVRRVVRNLASAEA